MEKLCSVPLTLNERVTTLLKDELKVIREKTLSKDLGQCVFIKCSPISPFDFGERTFLTAYDLKCSFEIELCSYLELKRSNYLSTSNSNLDC